MQNNLEIIVKESGLEKTKAQFLLDNFTDYFKIASDWETKARAIKVEDESQTAEMKMAREGRLFLRQKRIDIENARKQLKEQSLREGRAIDGIANVLKGLIVPIEEYLGEQEKFVENREKARLEAKRLEDEEKAEKERLAKERAERQEQERIRKENEKLRKEAEKKEKAMKKEREEAEKKQRELEEKLRKEAEEKQAILDEQKKKETEAKAEKERVEKEQKEKEQSDKFKNWLKEHGVTDDNKDDYKVVSNDNEHILFKKVSTLWT